MSQQVVTLSIPRPVYEQIRQAAKKKHRSVDELMVEAIAAAISPASLSASQLRSDLAQMAYLNDAALWQAARATLSPSQRERMEILHHKKQREELNVEEQAESDSLEALYLDTLLVRAQAAVLLKQRNYDISDPTQFAPLE
jgi:hypothetical protein